LRERSTDWFQSNPSDAQCRQSQHLIRDDVQRDRIRAELEIAPNAVVVGFVGSLRRWHGVEFLAEAIPSVIDHCPDCVFLIAGTGKLELEFKASVISKKFERSVRFTGGVSYDSVPGYIAAIDIGLMPDSRDCGRSSNGNAIRKTQCFRLHLRDR
jgi:glycosyltransferase involved in cell wall biosynthesis